MPTAAVVVSGVGIGNPIVITSGCYEMPIDNGGNNLYKIDRLYWFNANPGSTSSLIISKGRYNVSNAQVYVQMQNDTSGKPVQLNLDSEWWDRPWVNQMPTGTLYVYLE